MDPATIENLGDDNCDIDDYDEEEKPDVQMINTSAVNYTIGSQRRMNGSFIVSERLHEEDSRNQVLRQIE